MKKVLSLLVLALLGTNILWARHFFSATSPSGHTLYYVIEGGVAHVTHPLGDSFFNKRFENPWNGKGPTGALEIPARVTYNGNNYSVVSIGRQAFDQCSGLTSVTIPNSVTTIGAVAFAGTALYNNKSNWKNGVLYIGDCLIKADSKELFMTYNIAGGTRVIANGAFYECENLLSVTIPNSVTSIGSNAFFGCSGLTSVTIPNSVTSIGDGAFANCSDLTSVTIPNSVTTILGGAFFNCSGLTSVTIPNSVTVIGDAAFANCYGLSSVTIPNSVTTIGDEAFEGCSGLTSVTIPNSVTSIGNWAFRWCSNLLKVEVPSSVKSIGRRAFEGVKWVIYCGSAYGSPWGADRVTCP